MKRNDDQFYEVMLQTITAASQMPIVKVNREEFLRSTFKNDKYIDDILKNGPQTVYEPESLRLKAQSIIDNMTKKTSFVSFATGLPANPLFATALGGADVIQYFGFALNLAQQLAYLFGEDTLFSGGDTELSEETKDRLIVYLGVMFGVSSSSALIVNVSKKAGETIGKKTATKALTKTTWYPLIKKTGSLIGRKITKKTIGKSITKSLPIVGGTISGGLTYLTFKPMGAKLADAFYNELTGQSNTNNDMKIRKDFIPTNTSQIIDNQ